MNSIKFRVNLIGNVLSKKSFNLLYYVFFVLELLSIVSGFQSFILLIAILSAQLKAKHTHRCLTLLYCLLNVTFKLKESIIITNEIKD